LQGLAVGGDNAAIGWSRGYGASFSRHDEKGLVVILQKPPSSAVNAGCLSTSSGRGG